MQTLLFGAAIDNWRRLLWPIGGVISLAVVIALSIWWWRNRSDGDQPILFLFEQLIWNFRTPLLLVGCGSLALIGMGFAAGSQFSMILFVLLSALTVVGIGLIGWWLWPKDSGEGNLFDLVPLPNLEWPAYENTQDRIMRAWVEQRTNEMKSNPPAFSGATFGAIALEVTQEASQIYEKETPLSVSLDDLLRGLQRTAADLKILCNHLPLAGHFTLAAIERQIDFAVRKGRLLYVMLFLVLSFFNPGNLVRVLLAFVQQKSPWEHLLRELQGWIYGHYTERLGYHMALIHSRRNPPPPDALHIAFAEQERKRGETIRLQKLGWLAFLGLFGFAFYLLLQLVNVTMVFGLPGFFLGSACLLLTGYGVWQLRAPNHWEDLWTAILPKWPAQTPPEGDRELRARRQMAEVLRKHKQPPVILNTQDAKQLPEIYGDLMLELWEACYEAYRPESETEPGRTSREFYLPQGFAGVEDLCRALHSWFSSTAFLPRALRQLERFGLNLETIYLYIKKQSDEAQAEHGDKTQEPESPTEPKALPAPEVSVPDIEEDSDEADAAALPEEAEEEGETTGKRVLGWLGKVGRSLGNMVKGFAVKQFHQHVLKLMEEGIGERLLNIYGARHPQMAFAPTEPEAELRRALILSRNEHAAEVLLSALLNLPHVPTDTPDAQDEISPIRQCQCDDGNILQLEFQKMPDSAEDTEGLQAIADLIQYGRYQRLLLVDEIDYGARERIARLLQNIVEESLRTSDTGPMAVVLMGVEKLKPLKWEPPYDDYLKDPPERRKSQRIRNAVLAWSKVINQIPSMETIYPVGIPKEGEPWGLPSLRSFLGIPEEEEAALLPEETESRDEPQKEESLEDQIASEPTETPEEQVTSDSLETTDSAEGPKE